MGVGELGEEVGSVGVAAVADYGGAVGVAAGDREPDASRVVAASPPHAVVVAVRARARARARRIGVGQQRGMSWSPGTFAR